MNTDNTLVKPFIMVDYDLLKAKGFIDKEGKPVKLIANDKLVYCYIRARIKYFVEEQKGEYYDTQQAIADALCIDLKSARKSLDKFITAGILHAKKKLYRNYYNFRYSKIEDLTLFENGDKKDEIKIIEQKVVEFRPKVLPKKQSIPTPKWCEDESDLPF